MMLYDSQSKTYDVGCANFTTSMRPLFMNVHLREYLASAAHGPDAAVAVMLLRRHRFCSCPCPCPAA
jgi:hypothetical protein